MTADGPSAGVVAWELAGLIMGGFLAGSVPFGLLIGRMKGVDVRKHGSGNIGATNLGRLLGKRYFFLCFALDVLKGLLPTLGAGMALGTLGRLFVSTGEAGAWLACAVAPILGHVFCPWIGFKGGKGVATGLGATLAVFPALTIPAAGAFVVWALCAAVWRYVSLASVVAAISLPVWCAAEFLAAPRVGVEGRWELGVPFVIVCVGLAALVVWTHRENIRRLRAGTERRIGQRVKVG